MDATLRFLEMVNGPSTAVDLTEGWLLLGTHANPAMDVGAERARFDELAAACPTPDLDGLRSLLFDQLGFDGVTDEYYAPENSLPDHVLETRKGIPISLSAVMMEVGRRCGVTLEGIGMPGHFLVRDAADPTTYVDAFAKGRTLDRPACEELFRQLVGPQTTFLDTYLEPVSTADMLCRMAANLVNAYRRTDDRHGLRWAARLRARCPGVSGSEQAALANWLAHAGAFDEAATVLDGAAEVLAGEEAERSRQQAVRYRARLN